MVPLHWGNLIILHAENTCAYNSQSHTFNMSGIDKNHYGLYLAFSGKSDETNVHWMILLAHSGADKCMRFHCEGSPFVSESDTPSSGLEDSAY
jgi:hypothetical protein